MVNFDDLTKSFHKHLFDNVASTYYIHFSKLSVGDKLTQNLWIQPIWYVVPLFPIRPLMVKMTLKCQSIMEYDTLLTKLRAMADFCADIYSPKTSPIDIPDPYLPITQKNIIPIFKWEGAAIQNPTPILTVETFVSELQELPIRRFDNVAVININLNLLVCWY